MAIRPMVMLMASCWALLAISQDAIGVPAGSERIAAPQSHKNVLTCDRNGLDDLCRFPTRTETATDRSNMVITASLGQRQEILSGPAEVVPKPKVKPKVAAKKTKSKSKSKVQSDVTVDDDGDGSYSRIVSVARKYVGLSERSDRTTLASFFADKLDQHIDPARTPWCAAFINAVLSEAGYPTSGSNQGISFASYGTKVSTPRVGDIVVIKGGRSSRTHVGIYVGAEMRGNRKYIKLLGGNQSNHVQVSSYDARKIIAIRRPG